MKKKLSSLLVVVLVFTMLVPAFAFAAEQGKYTDVTDVKLANAVERLSVLGVLNGYTDGTFRPDQPITRAEFAKIVVAEIGLTDAAKMSVANTKFKDVKADNWASGFINVGVDQQLFKGYTDGTFKPERNVTQAEVLAVLIRAMGYEDTVTGSWPANYVVKAYNLELTKGVNVSANTMATRGQVALLADNALDIYKWGLLTTDSTGKLTYGRLSTTILTENLRVEVIPSRDLKEGVVVTGVPSLFGAQSDKVSVVSATYGDSGTYTLADGYTVDLSKLGHSVKLYVNTDGKVFYAQDLTTADQVIAGKVEDTDGIIKVDGTEYKLASGYQVYLNRAKSNLTNLTVSGDNQEGSSATLILDGKGYVQAVVAENYSGPDVVADVDTKNSKLILTNNPTVSVDDYDKATFIRNGQPAKFEDIQKDDVVQYYTSSNDKEMVLYATSNVVTGKFERFVTTGAGYGKQSIYVDGKKYSLNKNTPVDVDNEDALNVNELGNFVDKDVTLFLDKDGKVAGIKTNSGTATTTNYAVVLGGASNNQYDPFVMEVSDRDGKERTYNLAKKVTIKDGNDSVTIDNTYILDALTAIYGKFNQGDLISYGLDDNGNIDEIKLLADNPSMSNLNIDKDASTVNNFIVNDSTVVLGRSSADDYVAATKDQFLNASGTLSGYVYASNGVAKFVVVNSLISSESSFAFVFSRYQTSDTYLSLLTSNGDTKNYKVTGDVYGGDVYGGDVISYTTDGTAFDTISELNYLGKNYATVDGNKKSATPYVVSKDGNLLTVRYYDYNNQKVEFTVIVTKDTVVYDATGDETVLSSISNLAKGQSLKVYTTTYSGGSYATSANLADQNIVANVVVITD